MFGSGWIPRLDRPGFRAASTLPAYLFICFLPFSDTSLYYLYIGIYIQQEKGEPGMGTGRVGGNQPKEGETVPTDAPPREIILMGRGGTRRWERRRTAEGRQARTGSHGCSSSQDYFDGGKGSGRRRRHRIAEGCRGRTFPTIAHPHRIILMGGKGSGRWRKCRIAEGRQGGTVSHDCTSWGTVDQM